MNLAILALIAANAIRPGGDMRDVSMRPPSGVAAASLTIDAMPYARTVTCGSYTLTGSASGGGAVSWSASPSGASGACTGTTSWSCVVSVAPDATGEGVEVITVSQSGGASDTETIGFYVNGAHSCFLAQSVDGDYNSTLSDADPVATWVNLGSSAKDGVQATGTAQPSYRTSVTNGQPMVRFDGGDRLVAGVAADWTFLHDGTGSTISTIWSTTNSSTNTLVATSRATDRGFGLRYLTTFQVSYYMHNGTSVQINLTTANNTIFSGQYFDNTALLGSASTPDANVYTNGSLTLSGNATTFSSSAPTNALNIGSLPSPSSGFATGDCFRVLAYTTELTADQRAINKAVDEWALGGSLPVVAVLGEPNPYKWAFIGDSITAGSSGVTNWPTKLLPSAPEHVAFTNVAASGATVSAIRTQYDNCCVYPANVIPGKLFVLGGINDIRNGALATTTFTTLSGIYDAASAQGIEVIAMTILPNGNDGSWSAADQVQHEALNASIRTASVDTVIDLYDLMGEPGTPIDLAAIYDVGDGLHPSEAGTQFMADTVAATLGL